MYSGKLIEITQDAACVIGSEHKDAIGFFTDNVQTCLIYIIKTETATIAIHDSGQLCIQDLATLIKNHGKVFSVTLAHGPDLNEINRKRLPKLLSIVGYDEKPSVFVSKYKIFSVSYKANDGISINPNTTLEDVCRMPNKSIIQAIVDLNNNFIPLNSQSLPVDVQFRHGNYSNNSRLLFSLDEMLEIFSVQPQYIDINRMFLIKGEMAGLFTLPDDFHR